MMKRNFALTLVFTFFLVSSPLNGQGLPIAEPESVGMSSDRLNRLTETLKTYVNEDRLAGAVTIIARRGKIAYLEAIGKRDIEAGDPMQKNSIFRIASQTKALVSVGVMILQEEGKLLITDPIGKHLPEFMKTTVAQPNDRGSYDVVSARRPITIRHLLTHTAGISYGSGPASEAWDQAGITGWYFANRDETVGDVMGRLASLPLDAHPGEKWIYGFNTDILGAMIEKITNQTLGQFLEDRIFKPLGMNDTHFFLPKAKVNRLATVYSSKDEGGVERSPSPGHMVGQGRYVDGPQKSFSGGAGLLSTAVDYATFLQMLLNQGEFNGTRILSRKSVDLMTVDHVGDVERSPMGSLFAEGHGFGLGFSIVNNPSALGLPASVGEYAWAGAYHSVYWVDPIEEMVVVYLTQLIPARDIDDHGKVRALIHQAIID